VSREDILLQLLPVLRHRILLTFEAQMQKVAIDELLLEIARDVGRRG